MPKGTQIMKMESLATLALCCSDSALTTLGIQVEPGQRMLEQGDDPCSCERANQAVKQTHLRSAY